MRGIVTIVKEEMNLDGITQPFIRLNYYIPGDKTREIDRRCTYSITDGPCVLPADCRCVACRTAEVIRGILKSEVTE